MSWFLSKDNTNDALETATHIISNPKDDDFVVKWRSKAGSDTGTICAQNISGTGSSREFQIFISSGVFTYIFGGTTTASGYSGSRDGNFEARFEGTAATLFRNGILVDTTTISRGASAEATAHWVWGARHAGSNTSYGFLWDVDIGNCSIEELDGTLISSWDMDTASHAAGAVAVVDDIGSADIAGVNMDGGTDWLDDTFTAAITGTAQPTQTESDIVTGGKTIIITLTNDTWVAAGATFDAERQSIINMVEALQLRQANGWDNEVKDNALVGSVARISSTVVIITLAASASYDIVDNEAIPILVPSGALVNSLGGITATPTIAVTATTIGTIIPVIMNQLRNQGIS